MPEETMWEVWCKSKITHTWMCMRIYPTYKEAKAWLDKINANPHWNRVDIEEPALSQLTELVEKATPKDPPLYQDYDLKKEFWECPTCGSFLCKNGEEYGHGGYCEHCGQRINWGE